MNEEHKVDLSWCYRQMKMWRSHYCRINSTKPVRFQIRLCMPGLDQCFWKHYLELYMNDKLVEQHLIKPAASYVLTHGLSGITYQDVEFYTYESFEPKKQAK